MPKFSDFQSSIKTPVGNRRNSDPKDVISTRKNLKRIGRLKGDVETGIVDRDLDQTIRQFQYDEGLQVDGLINPGGETERALNRNLRGDKNAFGSRDKARLRLTGIVGSGQTNYSGDVKQVQRGLGTLGFIPKSRGFEPTGIIDELTGNGIRIFQRRNGLRVDGKLLPQGETEATINFALRLLNTDDNEEDMPAVPLEDIEREELSPPNIPGTNIPDQGIPEGESPDENFLDDRDKWRYEMDQDIDIPYNRERREWDI